MLIIETKTKNNEPTEVNLISEREYNNITSKETLKWFRRLGGSETAQKSYTCYGYKTYKLISRSPDRTQKTVREFSFHSLGYREQQIYNNLFKKFEDGLFYLKRFKEGKTIQEMQQIIKNKL